MDGTVHAIEDCLDDISSWMENNLLIRIKLTSNLLPSRVLTNWERNIGQAS